MAESMYALYLIQEDDHVKNTIFLGISNDPENLYINALNPQTAEKKDKSLILKWLTQVEAKLNEQEQREMDYAFMSNPQTEFSYSIKDMTLYITKIKVY
jgi:hypothetical protein